MPHGAAPESKRSDHQWLSDAVYMFVFFMCGDLYVFSFFFSPLTSYTLYVCCDPEVIASGHLVTGIWEVPGFIATEMG